VIARNPGRHGIKPLRRAAKKLRGPSPETRSGTERNFLELIRQAGLPEPSVSVIVLKSTVSPPSASPTPASSNTPSTSSPRSPPYYANAAPTLPNPPQIS
jgi:hypothetical protein